MPNAWMEHVRNFRKQNRQLSYKDLLRQAKDSYGGAPMGNESPSSLKNSRVGGSVTGYESPSSLTRSASKVGGTRRIKGKMGGSKMNLNHLLKSGTNTMKQAGDMMKGKLGGRKSRRRRS